MAGIQRAKLLTPAGALLLLAGVRSQRLLSPMDLAASRTGPDFIPSFEGQDIAVMSQGSTGTLGLGDSSLLPIEDLAAHGLILRGPEWQFAGLLPGDWLQAGGTIARHNGLPVMLSRQVQRLRSASPPRPQIASIRDVNSIGMLGLLVTTEGTVKQRDSASGTITISSSCATLDVPLKKQSDSTPAWDQIRPGDRVGVTDISIQSRTSPPFNRGFELFPINAAAVMVMYPPWSLPPWLLAAAAALTAIGAGIWLVRVRGINTRRRSTQILHQLSEELIASESPGDMSNKINHAFGKLTDTLQGVLWLYNRSAKTLERAPFVGKQPSEAIELDAPQSGIASGVALAFRNRTLLTIPDTRRSPFFNTEERKQLPRSIMLVPMFARNDLMGVFEVHYLDALHVFTQDEQSSMQHLANQAAAALRAQEHKIARERLFYTEKLAAANQVIGGIATELKSPLGAIVEVARNLRGRDPCSNLLELGQIETEALRATEIVSRLNDFGNSGEIEAQPVDLHALLQHLLRLRAPDLMSKGLDVHAQFVNQRILVLGSQAQLGKVFLNLLIYAEQAASEAREIAMTMTTGLLARRVVVELGYHTQLSQSRKFDPFENGNGGSMGLTISRAIIQSHGGDLRFIRVSPTQNRFEVEMPVMDGPALQPVAANIPRNGNRRLTVLLVEPETKAQKHILDVLSQRGDRVVPISNVEEAADLAQRLRFDVIFCAARLPSPGWAEFFKRVQPHTGSFVLLTQGYDPELVKAFQKSDGFVLSKPIDESQLNHVRDAVAEKVPGASRVNDP